jgi:hypothetical protein
MRLVELPWSGCSVENARSFHPWRDTGLVFVSVVGTPVDPTNFSHGSAGGVTSRVSRGSLVVPRVAFIVISQGGATAI